MESLAYRVLPMNCRWLVKQLRCHCYWAQALTPYSAVSKMVDSTNNKHRFDRYSNTGPPDNVKSKTQRPSTCKGSSRQFGMWQPLATVDKVSTLGGRGV
jgi:hypothetical protein